MMATTDGLMSRQTPLTDKNSSIPGGGGNPLAEPDSAFAGLRGLAPSRRVEDEDAGAADEDYDDVDPQ
jgi:hypothetical protein